MVEAMLQGQQSWLAVSSFCESVLAQKEAAERVREEDANADPIRRRRTGVAQIWFKRFQSGNFDIKDAHRSGRPVTDKIDAIFEKVEQDQHISSYDVAGELGIDHKTVLAHLKKAGYTKKLDIWVPHELTKRNLMNRVLICDSLLRRN
ncbi:hypothetical protein K1T71_009309 [Dendrolimus kikuchii]|uniref:Uncharacterized protein n=1 Tax=Dendrolimus kikuchii TaxID=765133 RepID=A0ACC1CUH6_9NEOP|nr:hypothetical protein K1T71_009309 [Dendrolimus kikuchii]